MSSETTAATHQESVEKIGKLIRGIKFAMLSTLDADGTIRSRPMATQDTEFDGTLWFFTRASAPKVEEVEKEHQVNVSYADPSGQTYISVSGLAQLVRDPAKNKELWTPAMKAWFPKGPEDPETALLKVSAEKAEYWDTPSSSVVHAIGLVKSVLTGKPAHLGDNEKITF
jgi:general stress protein 26